MTNIEVQVLCKLVNVAQISILPLQCVLQGQLLDSITVTVEELIGVTNITRYTHNFSNTLYL